MGKALKIISLIGGAGAGKEHLSKVSIAEAANRGCVFAATENGAVFRAAGLICRRQGVDPLAVSERRIEQVLRQVLVDTDVLQLGYRHSQNTHLPVYHEGVDVSAHLRTTEMDRMASALAPLGIMKDILDEQQQLVVKRVKTSGADCLIIDGREPPRGSLSPALTICLTADIEAKLKLRQADRRAWGQQEVGDEALAQALIERDRSDIKNGILNQRGADVIFHRNGASIEEISQRALCLIRKL